jgi:hypothetical protein
MSAATDRIANMVVGVGADPTELKSGLREGARSVDQFAEHVTVTADKMRDLLKQTGGDLQKAARLAAAAAQTDLGKVVPISSAAGYQAGKAMGESMSRGFAASNAPGNIRRAIGGRGGSGLFGGLGGGIGGGRATAAFVAGAFTIAGLGDAFAAGESKLTRFTQGLNSVLRSASIVAAFFEPPAGPIVAAVLAGTSFVLDFFAKTRDAADKMAKETEDRVKRLIDARDTAAQMTRVQEITTGLPSAGPSAFAAGAFAGGVEDLEAQINAAYQRIVEHNATSAAQMVNAVTREQLTAIHRGNDLFIENTQKEIRALIARLSPLVAERDRITAAILNPATGARATPGMQEIKVTAAAPGHEYDALAKRVQQIVRLYSTLKEAGNPVSAQTQQIIDGYIQLSHALDALTRSGADPFSDQVASLQELQAEIEKTLPRLNQIKEFTIPPGRTTPGGAPSGAPPSTAPTVDATPHFDALTRVLGVSISNIIRTIGKTVGSTLSGILTASLGPVALLFRALEPALRVLEPLLDKFVAPVAAIVQVIATSLLPVMKLLFPIVKDLGIVIAFVSEISQRAASLLARVIGNIVVAIGKLLQKISLGFAGKGLERLGKSFLSFADGAKNSADEMARIRKEIYGMKFGDTAESITGLGDAARSTADALLNVPYGFRIALERYAATIPGGPRSAPSPSGSNGGSTGGVPVGGGTPTEGRIVIQSLVINSQARDAEELFRDVAQVARQKAQQQYGTTARAADTFARGR